MTRQEANRKILAHLTDAVERYPAWRFQQILWNLELIDTDEDDVIEDRFYEEPQATLERMTLAVNYHLPKGEMK